MIVYVYDAFTNEKLHTFKGVTEIIQTNLSYILYQKQEDTTIGIPRADIKLTVYGF